MEYDVLDGFWGDAGESIDAYYEVNDFVRAHGGEQRVIDGVELIPLQPLRGRARLVHGAPARELAAAADPPDERLLLARGRDPRPPLPRARPGRPLRSASRAWRASSCSTARAGETFTTDIGDDNPVAVYIPGRHAHGFEALTDLFFCYHVTEEYDPADPDEHGIPWNDPRVVHSGARNRRSCRAGRRRVLVTGAGGQLGRALPEAFAGDEVSAHARRLGRDAAGPAARDRGLVLHAAAWTDVDGAEADPQGAAASTSAGRRTSPRSAPLVYYSTDYVFDGTKREPYVESDAPNPLSAYGRTKLYGGGGSGRRRAGSCAAPGSSGRRVTTSCGRCCGWAPSGTRCRRRRPASAVRPTSGTSRRRRGRSARAAAGVWHVAADGRVHVGRVRRGDLRGGGARLPRRADHDRGARAARPAARVLGSAQREANAPSLPHWREGLRECLSRLGAR